jgi:hypothetical protein
LVQRPCRQKWSEMRLALPQLDVRNHVTPASPIKSDADHTFLNMRVPWYVMISELQGRFTNLFRSNLKSSTVQNHRTSPKAI